jgi:hypothetical protein
MNDSVCSWTLNEWTQGALEGGLLAVGVLLLLVVCAMYLVSCRYDVAIEMRRHR